MRIELWSLDSFFGLIVLAPTGITWTNQTGGVSCNHPEAEGFLIPLPFAWVSCKDSLENEWGAPYDAARVGAWLLERQLGELFEPDPEATRLEEAWIPVRVLQDIPESDFHSSLLEGVAGKRAILTYPNSD